MILACWLCNLAGRGDSSRGVPEEGGRGGEGTTACGEAGEMGVEESVDEMSYHLFISCLCALNRSPTVRCMGSMDGWMDGMVVREGGRDGETG